MSRTKKYIVGGLLLWLFGLNTLLTLATLDDVKGAALVKMAWGLAILWVFIAGGLMYRYRDAIRDRVRRIPLDWRVTFVLFASLLALLEEAVTVSMTNLAPLFGVPIGSAFITASANYVDVVFFHSVIVFIPLFIAWALILSKYDFKPFSVFILFGFMGILAEISFGGVGQVLGGGQWILVYGLMIYLPAYSIPEHRGARPVGVLHHVLAIPVVFFTAVPLLLPIVYIIAVVLGHPTMHFVN